MLNQSLTFIKLFGSLRSVFAYTNRISSLVTIAIIFAAGASRPILASGKGSFTVKPAPTWVTPVNADTDSKIPAPEKESGIQYLLSDYQTRVSDRGVERYYHQVEKVVSPSGLGEISQLAFEFEPSFQELIIHQIRIIRNGKPIDALKPREVKIVQRENELWKQIYNGTLSALIFLNDVRTGDVVEYSYSVNGDNPVLKGRYADSYYLADNDPCGRIRHRLLWPANRPIAIRNRNTDVKPIHKTIGYEEEYIWDVADVPSVGFEDSAPSWFFPAPVVQISEFNTWNEVIHWALPLYAVKDSPSAALSQQIDHFRAENPTPDGQFIAAVRFVQDEVRYMGIELGPNSHQPTQPSVVFERRFGDCKDKSLLLATILNALGIDAHPALVNTDIKTELTNWQPTPVAFNHCIVQAKLSGKTYWIDPTISLQRGGVKQYYDPDYAIALVLADSSRDLEKIPETKLESPTTTVRERFTPGNVPGTVLMEVVTTTRGEDADDMRAQFGETSLAEMSRNYLNYYDKNFHSIEESEPLKYDDDEEKNIFTVTERYQIRDFWKDHLRELWADRIYSQLVKPNISRRSAPLGIHHPVFVEQIIEIGIPLDGREIAATTQTVKGDAFRLEYSVKAVDDVLVMDFKYRTLVDSLPPQKIAKHMDALDRARDAVGYQFKQGDIGKRLVLRSSNSTEFPWIPISILGLIVAPLSLIAGLRARNASRRRREFKASQDIAQGDSAATAIELNDETSLINHVTEMGCRCGKHYHQPCNTINREVLIYDGRRIILVQLRCSACNHSRDVYYVLQFEKSTQPVQS